MKKLLLLFMVAMSLYLTVVGAKGAALEEKAAPTATAVRFVATFSYESKTPPSCHVVKARLRNELKRISEVTFYLEQVARQRPLSLAETDSLRAITREFIPEILDQVDQWVSLRVKWDLGTAMAWNWSFAKVSAPGVRWDGQGTGLPPFLIGTARDTQVQLEYKMSIFDFCFGQNEVLLQGASGSSNVLLRAYWVPEVRSTSQTGISETFKFEW